AQSRSSALASGSRCGCAGTHRGSARTGSCARRCRRGDRRSLESRLRTQGAGTARSFARPAPGRARAVRSDTRRQRQRRRPERAGVQAYVPHAQPSEHAAGKRMPIQLSYHYTSIAHMLLQAGRIDESLAHYRSAVELTRGANFVPGLAQSLSMLGTLLLGLGRDAEARGHLEEDAQRCAQLKDREAEARLWTDIARVDELAHKDANAMACWSRARALRRELRDRAGELVAVEGLARVTRRHVSEPSFGLSYYVEAVALAATLGDPAAEGRLRNVVGILEWESGRHAA